MDFKVVEGYRPNLLKIRDGFDLYSRVREELVSVKTNRCYISTAIKKYKEELLARRAYIVVSREDAIREFSIGMTSFSNLVSSLTKLPGIYLNASNVARLLRNYVSFREANPEKYPTISNIGATNLRAGWYLNLDGARFNWIGSRHQKDPRHLRLILNTATH